MESENILLRKEIERLNHIIDILLASHKQLEKEFTAYVQAANRQIQPDTSKVQNGEDIQTINPSISQSDGRGMSANVSLYRKEDGGIQVKDSTVQSSEGEIKADASILHNNIGVKCLLDATLHKKVGVTNDHSSTANISLGGSNASNGANSALLQDVKPINMVYAELGLRAIMVTASRNCIYNTATILMQIYTTPVNSYKQMRHLTQLSEDGITKRIMAMKKAGLIARTGFQRYTLTDRALQILEAARK